MNTAQTARQLGGCNLVELFGAEEVGRVNTLVANTVTLSAYGDAGYSYREAVAALSMRLSVPGASLSGSEARRRMNMCIRLLEQMRGELRWSIQRIEDNLGRALRGELNGNGFNPSVNAHWSGERQC